MIRIKSKEDIQILREGGKRHAEILLALKAMVRPGVSTKALEEESRRLITEGGDTSAFLNYQPNGAVRPFSRKSLCFYK
jgi:methionyl aminopeptidase